MAQRLLCTLFCQVVKLKHQCTQTTTVAKLNPGVIFDESLQSTCHARFCGWDFHERNGQTLKICKMKTWDECWIPFETDESVAGTHCVKRKLQCSGFATTRGIQLRFRIRKRLTRIYLPPKFLALKKEVAEKARALDAKNKSHNFINPNSQIVSVTQLSKQNAYF